MNGSTNGLIFGFCASCFSPSCENFVHVTVRCNCRPAVRRVTPLSLNLNNVAGHRRAVGQLKRVRARGQQQSAQPESKNDSQEFAHGTLLANARALRKQIQRSAGLAAREKRLGKRPQFAFMN